MSYDYFALDVDRVELFLSRQLSDGEHTAFERHLDDCEECRMQLEASAAADNVWSAVRDSLRQVHIAENTDDGVDVLDAVYDAIFGNSIHDNTGLGIDLNLMSPTLGNNSQPAPVLTSGSRSTATMCRSMSQSAARLPAEPRSNFIWQTAPARARHSLP